MSVPCGKLREMTAAATLSHQKGEEIVFPEKEKPNSAVEKALNEAGIFTLILMPARLGDMTHG